MRESVCVSVRERERERVCVFLCERERESVCVSVRERERERERALSVEDWFHWLHPNGGRLWVNFETTGSAFNQSALTTMRLLNSLLHHKQCKLIY